MQSNKILVSNKDNINIAIQYIINHPNNKAELWSEPGAIKWQGYHWLYHKILFISKTNYNDYLQNNYNDWSFVLDCHNYVGLALQAWQNNINHIAVYDIEPETVTKLQNIAQQTKKTLFISRPCDIIQLNESNISNNTSKNN